MIIPGRETRFRRLLKATIPLFESTVPSFRSACGSCLVDMKLSDREERGLPPRHRGKEGKSFPLESGATARTELVRSNPYAYFTYRLSLFHS